MLRSKKNYNILGVMNGTSIDGVDYVLCSWNKESQNLRVLDHVSKRFPEQIKKHILHCAKGLAKVEELSLAHYELGKMYAKQIKSIQSAKDWRIDLVALHGQTIFHSGKNASLQIGETSFISKGLGIPVLSDFRSADIALGGQGAPLAGLFHEYLFNKKVKAKSCVFQNLGGIANLSYFDKKEKKVFDTGPANMLMDLFLLKYSKGEIHFDKNGSIAAKGKANALLFQKMYMHPFFRKKAPKSCGREEFGEVFLNKFYKQLKALGLYDAIATLNWLTAYSVFDAYRKFLPQLPEKVYLCGGGAKNKTLVKNLSNLLEGNSEVFNIAKLGIKDQEVEAAAFAYLGGCYISDKALNLPAHTGASKKAVLGKLSI
ncbi:MAG: anhydro-N-acetylmuramic acid kinase [Bdellovibrionota bacterium]|nr:anhydro-N-acetylmuramic acid kinase [Bdellovibrionota bacterium]